MMASHLNSVILEGTLTDHPALIDGKATFTVQSIKDYNRDDIYVSRIQVEIKGDNLTNSCMKNLHKGSGVRVVGYLKQYPSDIDCHSYVAIVAEHVEFIPLARKGKTE